MRRIGFCLLLLAGLPCTLVARKVSVDDLMALRSIPQVSLSPDGQWVAYVVSTPSVERAEHQAVLYLVPSRGGEPRRLTYTTRIFNKPLPTPRLRWSPDGSRLSFLAYVGDTPQVLALPLAGGEPRALTSGEEGVTQYEWSPDGKRLAFVAPDPLPAEVKERQKNKSYVIEVDRNPRFPRLWLQQIEGGPPRPLTPPNQALVDFQWAPDSTGLVYSASSMVGFFSQYKSRIYTISAAGGEPRLLVDRPGLNRSPAYSPDGRWIAFVSTGGYEGLIAAEDLHLISADGNPTSLRNLTAKQEAWIGQLVWTPDSKSILYLSSQETYASGEHMFEQPIQRLSLPEGRVESLVSGPYVHYSVSISKDGRRIAFRQVESRTMGDVYVMDLAEGKPVRLTDVNPQLRELDLGQLKPISWKSFDGKQIWGLLLTPPGYQPGQRIPLVVYCHGGPIGGFTYGIFPQFMHIPGQVDPYPSEAMAGAGMAVLFPMPRGGSGYGTAGFREIIKSWGEKDYRDIMAGVDYLIAEGLADPERLGVMGASYGGFMTSWIVTQTNRFKAASTGASVNDLAQLYYLSDAGDVMAEYFAVPWEAPELLSSHSPITYAGKVSTPLLIQHGENDLRVPVSQAKAFYKALKDQKKTVELEIYPRGGHVNFEPPLEREYMRRNLEWFLRYLKSGSVSVGSAQTEKAPKERLPPTNRRRLGS